MSRERKRKNNTLFYLCSIVSITSLCFFLYLKYQNLVSSTKEVKSNEMNKIKILGGSLGNTTEPIPSKFHGGRDTPEMNTGSLAGQVYSISPEEIYVDTLVEKMKNNESMLPSDIQRFLIGENRNINEVLTIVIETIGLEKAIQNINTIYSAFIDNKEKAILQRDVLQAFKDSSLPPEVILGEASGPSDTQKTVLNKTLPEEYAILKDIYSLEEKKPHVPLSLLKSKYKYTLKEIRDKPKLYSAPQLRDAGYTDLNEYTSYNGQYKDNNPFSLYELLQVNFKVTDLYNKGFRNPNEYLEIYRNKKEENLINLKIVAELFPAKEMNLSGIPIQDWKEGGATIDWFIPNELVDNTLQLPYTQDELATIFKREEIANRVLQVQLMNKKKDNIFNQIGNIIKFF